MTTDPQLTAREVGALLGKSAPPLTDEQVESAARILATVTELPGHPEE